MTDIVTIRVDDTDVAVRSVVLMSCSPVLEGILRDGDPEQPRVITMDDADVDAVKAFVELASMLSHDAEDVRCMGYIAGLAAQVMPLVHKYDAKGMLNVLKSAINADPKVEHVMAIVKHASDADGIEWMAEKTKATLMKDLSSQTWSKDLSSQNLSLIEPEQKMADLPHKTAVDLLCWAMTQAKYSLFRNEKGGTLESSVARYLKV